MPAAANAPGVVGPWRAGRIDCGRPAGSKRGTPAPAAAMLIETAIARLRLAALLPVLFIGCVEPAPSDDDDAEEEDGESDDEDTPPGQLSLLPT